MWLDTGGGEPSMGIYAPSSDYKPVNRVWCVPNIRCHQRIERVNLQEDDRPGPHVFYHRLGDEDPQNYFAHAMPRPQQVAPGTYWYR